MHVLLSPSYTGRQSYLPSVYFSLRAEQYFKAVQEKNPGYCGIGMQLLFPTPALTACYRLGSVLHAAEATYCKLDTSPCYSTCHSQEALQFGGIVFCWCKQTFGGGGCLVLGFFFHQGRDFCSLFQKLKLYFKKF